MQGCQTSALIVPTLPHITHNINHCYHVQVKKNNTIVKWITYLIQLPRGDIGEDH